MLRVCIAVVAFAACSSTPRRSAPSEPVVPLTVVNALSVPLCRGWVKSNRRFDGRLKAPLGPGERWELDVPKRAIEIGLHSCEGRRESVIPPFEVDADGPTTLVVHEPGHAVPPDAHSLVFTPPQRRTEPPPSAAATPPSITRPQPCPPPGTPTDAAAAAFLMNEPMLCGSQRNQLLIRNTCARSVRLRLDYHDKAPTTVEVPASVCTVIDDHGVTRIGPGDGRLKGCFSNFIIRVGCNGYEQIEGPWEP